MTMKPAPTKVALLMSAAGLGLSLPAGALAHVDANGRLNVAVEIGVPDQAERRACTRSARDGLVPCHVLGGDSIEAAESDSALAPLAAKPWPSADVEWSLPVFEAYSSSLALPPIAPHRTEPTRTNTGLAQGERAHRAGGVPTLGRPNESPAPEGLGTVLPIGDSAYPSFDIDAIAMAAMADPPSQVRPPQADVSATPEDLPSDALRPQVGMELRATREPPARSASEPTRSAHSADDGLPDAIAVEDDLAALGSKAHSGSEEFLRAAEEFGHIGLSSPGSIERVLGDLFDYVGSYVEESLPPSGATELQTHTPAPDPDPVTGAPTFLLEELAVAALSAPQSDFAGYACVTDRLDAANDIVVAPHGDRVLMSLEALLSGESLLLGGGGAQTRQTIVASHGEKVMATLAALRQSKARKPARAAAAMPADVQPARRESATHESGGPRNLQEILVVAAKADGDAANAAADQHAAHDTTGATLLEAKVEPATVGTPATQEPVRRNPIGQDAVAMSAERLDEVRGGFVSDDGLKISFGIERAVYLNGSLVTTTSLNVADLSKITGGQAQITTSGTGSLALVQSGQGNTYLPGSISQTAAGIVIQNSLDNQKIQTITRIDAVVNSSGIIRSMNLQSSMRSAIVDSLRR